MRLSVKSASIASVVSLSLLAAGGMSMAASAPSTASLEQSHPAMQQVLSYGCVGHWVMTLQADLALLGYTQVGPMDGIFGPKTEAGLKAFQQSHGFTATGVTSPAVWQDILAGFGLVAPYVGSQQTAGSSPSAHWCWMHYRAQKGGSANTSLSSSAGNSGLGTSGAGSQGGASASTANGSVLPAQFPTGGTPVDEPSLASPADGAQGEFTPSITEIDGRPVLKAFHMVATSYGPSLQDNYPYGAVDYYGQPLEDGMVAVDPSVIPLGTVVYVTGYQDNFLPSGGFLGQAMDTGGAIQGDRIDIFINASENVINDFGVQQVTVYELGN